MRREAQRGKITAGAAFWTLVLVAVVYLGIKIVPIYVNNFQFADAVQNEARLALVNRKTSEQIRDTIFTKAQELALPLARDQIRVEVELRTVRIYCEYDAEVELPGYTLRLHFNPSSTERSLF
jgi:hypothetical protein